MATQMRSYRSCKMLIGRGQPKTTIAVIDAVQENVPAGRVAHYRLPKKGLNLSIAMGEAIMY